jgi:hexokinase
LKASPARAAREGRAGAGAAGFLPPRGGLSSREVGEFCRNPGRATGPLAEAAAAATGEDRHTLVHLIDRLVERAAKLTAINISSMVLRSGGGRDPCRPVCVTAEGSFLYGMRYMKPRVESYLKGYLTDRKGRYVEMIGIENAPLIGAAIAGLTH